MRYSSRTNLLRCVCLESGIRIRTGQVLNGKAMGAIFIFMKELEVPSLQRIDSFWRVPEGRNAFWMVSRKPYKNRRTAGRRLSHVACDFNMHQPGSDPEKATGSCFLLSGGFGVSWV